MSSWVDSMVGGDDNSLPPAELTEFEASVRLVRQWDRDVGAGSDEQFVNLRPALHDGRLYVADRKGRVLALDAQTGKEIWSVKVEQAVSAGPGAGAGLVILGTSDADVIALDAEDGALRWQARVRSEVLAVPRIDFDKVIVQTSDGSLAGLDLDDGSQLWLNDHSVPVLTLRGTGTPAVQRGLVVAGFATGKLAAFSAQQGFQVWEESIAIPQGRSELERIVDIDGDPVIDGDAVFVTTYQGRVARLDVQSGAAVWEREMSSSTGLSVDYSQVYVTDQDSHIWALSRNSGATGWKQDALANRGLTVPEPFAGYVVVGDAAGYLHVLSRYDGAIAGRVELGGKGIRARPLGVGDLLYVYGNSGRLAAYTLETL
jgi:outer membrane protein assembly factor BamB